MHVLTTPTTRGCIKMAITMKLIIGVYFVALVNGLYEDQVGDSDWRQSYLGQVTWMSFDGISGGRRKILLASESGVLAAVNAASGKIVWRHEQETDSLFAVAHHQSNLITVSGTTTLILRSWNIDTGLLKWEVPTDIPTVQQGWKESLGSNGVVLELAGNKRDALLLVADDIMAVYSTRSGKQQWNTTLPSSGAPLVSVDGSQVSVWLPMDGQMTFSLYDITKGHTPLTTSVITDAALSRDTQCVLYTNTANLIAPLCVTATGLVRTDFKKDKLLPIQSNVPLADLTSGPKGYIHIGSSLYQFEDNDKRVTHVCDDCRMGEVIGDKGDTVRLIVRVDGLKLVIENTIDKETLVLPTQPDRGGITRLKLISFHKSDSSLAWRVVLVRDDASVSLLSQTGTVVWTREDGLGTIVAVETVDLPSDQLEADGFLSLLDSNANPFMQAMTRLKLQAAIVQDVIADVIERGVASLIQPLSSEELLRDKFNMRKVIVALTAHNKIYGLDTSDGRVLWQLYLSTGNSAHLMYTTRTSSHPPYHPLITLIGNTAQCNGSSVYTFNPMNGQLVNQQPECLSQVIVQSLVLPVTDDTHRKIIVFIDDVGVVGCYPSGCGGVSLRELNVFMYLADAENSVVKGYKIDEEGREAEIVWQVKLPVNERIITVSSKPHTDLAHSMGRVRANRDVQYKYLNPHVISIVTKSFEQPNKPSLAVYLIDSVSGGVVYRSSHRMASDPVGVVLCENWILYHYFSVKSQRHEISVVEMYDPRNETESVWSSLSPPTLPAITSQAYVFPTSIVTMTTTTTHKGITPKSLLLGLPSGHILSLKKDFFDPRRLIVPTQQMNEEGVMPYMPDIPLIPQAYINYNQTVTRLRGIHTTSTGLESTSLIFSYGLDLYMTRAQPSGQFDLLAEDFDYLLVAGVVLALVLGTLLLSWLSSRKTLKSLWK